MVYNPYSIAKHTLLPLLYTIRHANSLSYLVRDPRTSSLLLLPSGTDRNALKPHISNIQQQFDCKLTHNFTNSAFERQSGPLFGEELVTAQGQGQLRPLLVGQISVCYIGAFGFRPDYHIVAVTHSSPVSTKFSVLFPGTLLSVCSIDLEAEVKAAQYCNTLNKLKFFPSQTLVFPEKISQLDDLLFAKALQSNAFLDQKIDLMNKKPREQEDVLIPTSMLSQKMMNPFLSPQKYSSLLGTSQKSVCFDLLRRMRKEWQKQ